MKTTPPAAAKRQTMTTMAMVPPDIAEARNLNGY